MGSAVQASKRSATEIADEVVEAYLSSARDASGEGAWIARLPGATATVSGLPYASYNSVFVERGDADPEVVRQLIGRVAASGLPFGLKTRPNLGAAVEDLVRQEGFEVEERLPLMSLEPEDFRAAATSNLPFRRLGPTEDRIHLQLVADSLQAPVEVIGAVMSERKQATPAWKTYLGEVGSQLAVTGTAVRCADHVNLISIATDPGHRRMGHAAALTSHMVEEAFASGARRVFLHSSEMGQGLYEQLGFRLLEPWSLWAKVNSDS